MRRPASVAALLLALPAAALASDAPLALNNPSALARAATLPRLGHAHVAPRDAASWQASLDLTNEFVTERDDGTELLLDGETRQWTLAVRRGIGARVDLTAELAVLHQDGGFMDATIERWHDAFSLPDGDRPSAPQDRYRYALNSHGRAWLDVDDSGTRLGDVQLGAGWQWRPGTALRAQLTLPTGDAQHLSGGALGAALWVDAALPMPRADGWSGFVSAGGAFNDARGPLAELQNRGIVFAGFGIQAPLGSSLSAVGQLYAHSALYEAPNDAQLDAFRPGLQGALALRWRYGANGWVDLGFQEDLIVASSADFSLHLSVNWAPARSAP